jgi:hypothetical protein
MSAMLLKKKHTSFCRLLLPQISVMKGCWYLTPWGTPTSPVLYQLKISPPTPGVSSLHASHKRESEPSSSSAFLWLGTPGPKERGLEAVCRSVTSDFLHCCKWSQESKRRSPRQMAQKWISHVMLWLSSWQQDCTRMRQKLRIPRSCTGAVLSSQLPTELIQIRSREVLGPIHKALKTEHLSSRHQVLGSECT